MKKNQSVNEFSLFTTIPKNRTTKNVVVLRTRPPECAVKNESLDTFIFTTLGITKDKYVTHVYVSLYVDYET